MVTHSGYKGTVTTKTGETAYTRGLYPRCDYGILKGRLEAAKRAGEITDYKIEWITVTE